MLRQATKQPVKLNYPLSISIVSYFNHAYKSTKEHRFLDAVAASNVEFSLEKVSSYSAKDSGRFTKFCPTSGMPWRCSKCSPVIFSGHQRTAARCRLYRYVIQCELCETMTHAWLHVRTRQGCRRTVTNRVACK